MTRRYEIDDAQWEKLEPVHTNIASISIEK